MKALRDYLKSHGITQQQFAEKMDVRQPTLNDWLSGRWEPSFEKLRKIRRLTGISVDELVERPK